LVVSFCSAFPVEKYFPFPLVTPRQLLDFFYPFRVWVCVFDIQHSYQSLLLSSNGPLPSFIRDGSVITYAHFCSFPFSPFPLISHPERGVSPLFSSNLYLFSCWVFLSSFLFDSHYYLSLSIPLLFLIFNVAHAFSFSPPLCYKRSLGRTLGRF